MPDGDNPYLRENFQRNCISRGLVNSSSEDLIIISDLDEIPNPKIISKFKLNMKFAVFKQKHFYYKINLQSEKYPFWYGSRICVKKYLKSPQWLRGLKFKTRPFWRIDKFRLNNILEDGGWHFCNLKTPEQLLYKYQNLCETNDQYVFKEKIDQKYLTLESIKEKIFLGKDIIGRDENYKIQKLDDSYPKYILENRKELINWIL
jgi:beta-1,4-mannosyl-glycoprotein beta-1,4-N-acetylglucosaminyltransferase